MKMLLPAVLMALAVCGCAETEPQTESAPQQPTIVVEPPKPPPSMTPEQEAAFNKAIAESIRNISRDCPAPSDSQAAFGQKYPVYFRSWNEAFERADERLFEVNKELFTRDLAMLKILADLGVTEGQWQQAKDEAERAMDRYADGDRSALQKFLGH